MTGSTAALIAAAATTPAGVGRLRASRDVRAVFAARRASGSTYAVVHARHRGDAAQPRFTVIAGKTVGNAVERNRVKRRLRAAVATVGLRSGLDYVVVGRAAALAASFEALCAALRRSVDAVSAAP